MHVGSALWSRRCEYDLSRHRRTSESNLLGDEAPDREPKDVDLFEVHGVEELQRTQCRLGNRVRDPSFRPSDPLVVEGDHSPVHGQIIDERWVPVVEVAPEVLEENDGSPVASGVAVGKTQTRLRISP